MICLFLLGGLMPILLQASTIQTPCTPNFSFSVSGGGYIILIQGLQDTPTTLQVPLMKGGDGQNPEIKAIILADDGSTVHTLTTEKLTIDFSKLVLSAGDYILIVEVGLSIKTLDFSID